MRGASALLFAVTVATPVAARAGVVVGEGVPFTSGDLTAALAARGADEPVDILVEVPPGPTTDVRVTTPAGAWTISLGDARGPSAARLVALHVVEPAGTGGAASPPGVPSKRVAAASLETLETLDTPVRDGMPDDRAAAPRPTSRWISLTGGGGRGAGGDDLSTVSVGFELATGRGPWLGGVELSVQASGEGADPPAGAPVSTSMGQLRAVLGVRQGPVELVAGPFAGVLLLDEVAGSRARMMTGLGAAARLRQPLPAAGWSLQLSAGADAYRHRVIVEAAGVPITSTPRVAFLATVGLSRELGR